MTKDVFAKSSGPLTGLWSYTITMTMSGLLPVQLGTKMDVLLLLKVWEQPVAATLVLKNQSD